MVSICSSSLPPLNERKRLATSSVLPYSTDTSIQAVAMLRFSRGFSFDVPVPGTAAALQTRSVVLRGNSVSSGGMGTSMNSVVESWLHVTS